MPSVYEDTWQRRPEAAGVPDGAYAEFGSGCR
jgi:hypothetical protein